MYIIRSVAKVLLVASILISISYQFEVKSSNEYKEEKNKSRVDKIVNEIKQRDPSKPISQKIVRSKKKNSEFVSSQPEIKVTFDIKNKKLNLSHKLRNRLEINFASSTLNSLKVGDDKLVYLGENSDFDKLIEPVEGGVRQILYIKSPNQNSYYDFPMTIAKGDKIEVTDGEVIIKTSKDKVKIGIPKPWAVDAKNQNLKTWYTVEKNSILRQHIDFTNAAFPVIADPTWCGNFIKKMVWENRKSEGGVTLKNTPT